MLDERIAGPVGGLEIAHDQEFRRRIKADLDALSIDRPAALRRDSRCDGAEIGAWQPVVRFRNIGEADAEIAAQTFLQRLVGSDVVVAEAKIERRPLAVAHEVDRQQDQRRLAQRVRSLVLVPAQKSEGEKEDVDAALFLGGLGVAVNCVQAFLQHLRREGRL